jgi:hypothetical protein
MTIVRLSLDISAFEAALVDIHAKFSGPVLEVVYRLVCSPVVFPKLFRFNRDTRRAAGGAVDEQRILLEPTDGYLNLLVALRALERGGLVVPEAGHR